MCFAADVVVVLVVHNNDVVEVGKVMACVELTGDVVNAIAASCTMLSHPLVGQLAYMPRADASRVDVELVRQPCVVNVFLHDGVCRRRAADVAQADEKNLCLVHIFL